MSTLAIRGGTVIDARGSRRADVVIGDEGTILAVGSGLTADQALDAGGCFVAPGLVDLHVHLRQPGNEEAETIDTGARAAALGGFTAVVAMPNTDPAMDCVSVISEVRALGESAICEVVPSAAISVGRQGEALAPMAELVRAGVRIFTDDGAGVQDDKLMRTALDYASSLAHLCPGETIVLAQHCEVESLSKGGYMHEGSWSSWLGIPGQPSEAEELMVMRDIALCRLTGARVHFQHMSTAGSISMIRAAKAAGLPVTAEAATHHFSLTDACCQSYDPVYKVHPPLRTDADVEAVKAGLADGTIDAIATDHAPHTPKSKQQTFADAPPGMLGLETAFAVANTYLDMPIESLLGAMSWRPAAICGLNGNHGGPIEEGSAGNLTVIDPNAAWTVSAAELASRSSNTPYEGMALRGRVRHTIYKGEAVVIDGVAQR
ncbi:MAG: dihydroorotase [Acidimicrobiaceae bacterium]|nr:dihydroorotase [Acidimicrobiaceae bacterium]MYC41302.1 dihydroorotase [Acidimicrobiaceae bacterium]MYC43728.1 dihydroorotase [Acidimicrobiaceae bacterium]